MTRPRCRGPIFARRWKRRLAGSIDRIGGALEDGRLAIGVRLLADPADRQYLTGLAAILAVRVLVQVFRRPGD